MSDVYWVVSVFLSGQGLSRRQGIAVSDGNEMLSMLRFLQLHNNKLFMKFR